MANREKFEVRLKFCLQCAEIYSDKKYEHICRQTMQPIFLMYGCPMGDSRVKTNLDAAYVWFPNAGFAIAYCKTVAYGTPCKFFSHPGTCEMPGFNGDIKKMRFCPCKQFDLNTWETLNPIKNYEIIRGYDENGSDGN